MSTDWEGILSQARFTPSAGVQQPFYFVQLNSREEKDLDGALVSDGLARLVTEAASNSRPYSHMIFLTHGWSTTAKGSLDNPFGQFVSGLMDDSNRPQDAAFNPLFVCFAWEGQPDSFIQDGEAMTREQLLEVALRALSVGEDGENRQLDLKIMSKAMSAATKRGTTREAKRDILLALSDELAEEDVPGLDVEDTLAKWHEREDVAGEEESSEFHDSSSDDVDFTGWVLINSRKLTSGPLGWVFKKVVGEPLLWVFFGRLLKRARKTGLVMNRVIAKLMQAAQDCGTLPKVNIAGNSAGTHLVAAALGDDAEKLPYKVHSAMLFQGAIEPAWFAKGGRFYEMKNNVAGPITCTMSKADRMLENVYNVFYNDGLGWIGFPGVPQVLLKSKSDFAEQGYSWKYGSWNTIDGTKFINDGDAVLGGHSDFKEDETVSFLRFLRTDAILPRTHLTLA